MVRIVKRSTKKVTTPGSNTPFPFPKTNRGEVSSPPPQTENELSCYNSQIMADNELPSPNSEIYADNMVISPTPEILTVNEVASPIPQNVAGIEVPSSFPQIVVGSEDTAPQNAPASNRPREYLTKFRKVIKKSKEKLKKKTVFDKAVADMHRGKFKSLRKCAAYHKVPLTTLHRLLCNGDQFQGSGKTLDCLSLEEEAVILRHVKWRAQIGCGVDFGQLQSLVQESLLALKAANPDRQTGYEETGQMPNKDYVRRMVARNNLSLRRTAEISKGYIINCFLIFRNHL